MHEHTSIQHTEGPKLTAGACPVCLSTDIYMFVDIPQVPIHCHLPWKKREEALRIPKGDIQLGFCKACEHVFNEVFDPGRMEYDQDYENSLHFSPRFQTYAHSLATRLIERYDLRDKDIIEIGCGQGDFLTMLCESGRNRGLGFEPSFRPERHSQDVQESITIIQDFYSEKYANYRADFVVCRHVLEHIKYPRDFLVDVRDATGNCTETVFYFEVPNVAFTLRDLGIWDVIYEHCSYFSAKSLVHLFRACGFTVHECSEAFDGQFLRIEASPATPAIHAHSGVVHDAESLLSNVESFADTFHHTIETWRREIATVAEQGKHAVIWGAGSKGVTFLNALRVHKEIEFVVDINPGKHGNYVAGTGQQIVPPDFLREYAPALVIVMNQIYLNEIKGMMQGMHIASEVRSA